MQLAILRPAFVKVFEELFLLQAVWWAATLRTVCVDLHSCLLWLWQQILIKLQWCRCIFFFFSLPSCRLSFTRPPADRTIWAIWRSWLLWLRLWAMTWTTEESTTPTYRGNTSAWLTQEHMIGYACVWEWAVCTHFSCVCVCLGATTHWPSSTAIPPWSITTSTTASLSSTVPYVRTFTHILHRPCRSVANGCELHNWINQTWYMIRCYRLVANESGTFGVENFESLFV